MATKMKCSACNRNIKAGELIICSCCKFSYHYLCLNITSEEFEGRRRELERTLVCPGCSSITRRQKKDNTPVRGPSHPLTRDHTVEPVNDGASTHGNTSSQPSGAQAHTADAPVTEGVLRNILETFKQDITGTIKQVVVDVVAQRLSDIMKQISDFHDSLSFLNEQHENLKQIQADSTKTIEKLQSENSNLHSTIRDLSTRLTLVEQHQRENNVEINGVPEYRNENLANCLMQLCKTVDAQVTDSDIMQVTRVAKMNKEDKRPRMIVAKLRSPRLRDMLLAAVHNFNKKNRDDKLGSHHLGLAGKNTPVFVAEHLTPTNKSLHAAARKKAKEMSYTFVWVRGGRVYVRKDETSQALLIRNMDSIKMIN